MAPWLLSSLPAVAALVLVVGVVVLYNFNTAFRYHARFTAFTVLLMLTSSAPIPLMLRRPRDSRNALIPAWGARQVSRVLGLSWELRGLEQAKTDGGCVVLINHQSALDMLVLAELWPRLERCAVIAKKEVFYLWPFGLATWLWGTIFIDRLNAEQARSTVASTARAVQQDRISLLMFPEGTRSNGAQLLPFKKGAFHVAIDAQAPLVPVVVSRYYFLDAKKKKFDSGSNIISVLPPVPTKGLSRDDLEVLLDRTRVAMQEEHTRISAEAARRAAAAGDKRD